MRAALYGDCHDCRHGMQNLPKRSVINDVHVCSCRRRWRLVRERRWRLLWAALRLRRVFPTHGDLMWVFDGISFARREEVS